MVNAPRGAIYTAPIGLYSTRTLFPDDSYLTNGRNVWLVSADAPEGGTRDESLRESAWEVIVLCALYSH